MVFTVKRPKSAHGGCQGRRGFLGARADVWEGTLDDRSMSEGRVALSALLFFARGCLLEGDKHKTMIRLSKEAWRYHGKSNDLVD